MRDALEEFKTFNINYARRSPELMRFKIARMSESAFAFFRGTFHLFARDVLDHNLVPLAIVGTTGSEMELVGDIHSENYGTYKGEDGLIHYDINDFDETTHGTLDFDVCRFAVNMVLASQERHDSLEDQVNAVTAGLSSYLQTLQGILKKGKSMDLDYSERHPGDSDAIAQLIAQKVPIKRSRFIAELTEEKNGQRLIKRSLLKYFNLSEVEKKQAERLLEDFKQRFPPPAEKDFFEIHDICGRISGIGSMGRYRYVVLVSGKGHAEKRNVLLEFKEARPSAYDVYRQREMTPEALLGRARKVIEVQRLSEAVCSPYLGDATDGELSFQVREISPHADRVDCKGLKMVGSFVDVLRVQAAILARSHVRAFARGQGPSNPLAIVGDAERFRQRVLAFALSYADIVFRDWSRFTAARNELEDVAHFFA